MSGNGTYKFAYCGATGVGIGLFTIKDGVITGADWGGVKYSGAIAPDNSTGGFVLDFTMTVPADAGLVQGLPPLGLKSSRTRSLRWPADFDNGQPVPVDVDGEITLLIRPVPGDLAAYWGQFVTGFKAEFKPA
jgi:hypothetical protein